MAPSSQAQDPLPRASAPTNGEEERGSDKDKASKPTDTKNNDESPMLSQKASSLSGKKRPMAELALSAKNGDPVAMERLKRRREISRRSSQKHRQRERDFLEEQSQYQAKLQVTNRRLKQENEQLRVKIATIKQLRAANPQQLQLMDGSDVKMKPSSSTLNVPPPSRAKTHARGTASRPLPTGMALRTSLSPSTLDPPVWQASPNLARASALSHHPSPQNRFAVLSHDPSHSLTAAQARMMADHTDRTMMRMRMTMPSLPNNHGRLGPSPHDNVPILSPRELEIQRQRLSNASATSSFSQRRNLDALLQDTYQYGRVPFLSDVQLAMSTPSLSAAVAAEARRRSLVMSASTGLAMASAQQEKFLENQSQLELDRPSSLNRFRTGRSSSSAPPSFHHLLASSAADGNTIIDGRKSSRSCHGPSVVAGNDYSFQRNVHATVSAPAIYDNVAATNRMQQHSLALTVSGSMQARHRPTNGVVHCTAPLHSATSNRKLKSQHSIRQGPSL